jgi:hypothetical protein
MDEYKKYLNLIDKETLQAIDNDMGIITLVTGEVEDGSSHYAYAKIYPSKYFEFLEVSKKGNYDLSNYGEILAHGEGSQPPIEVQKEMEEKHGADNKFESELVEFFEKLYQELT